MISNNVRVVLVHGAWADGDQVVLSDGAKGQMAQRGHSLLSDGAKRSLSRTSRFSLSVFPSGFTADNCRFDSMRRSMKPKRATIICNLTQPGGVAYAGDDWQRIRTG
jgi:hypothetical protein